MRRSKPGGPANPNGQFRGQRGPGSIPVSRAVLRDVAQVPIYPYLADLVSYKAAAKLGEAYAASALGFMTISQYSAAGGLTVAGIPFYKNMGVHWILTIPGCLSIMMVPVLDVFYRPGSGSQKYGKYAVAEKDVVF